MASPFTFNLYDNNFDDISIIFGVILENIYLKKLKICVFTLTKA